MSNITTRAGRGKLEDRKEPHWMKLRAGCFLGFATGPQSWHARYRDRTGKQNWKPLGDGMDYNEAKAEAERWFDLATSGNRKAPSRGTVRSALASYVLNLRSNGRRPTAVEVAGRFHITVPRDKEFGHMKLEDVGRDDVETWRNGLRKGRQPRSVNRQVRAVIAALNFAVSERGFVGKREAWELKHFQDDGEEATPVFLTSVQRDRLVAAAPPALAALLTGYTHTGCRPSELEKAVVADFDEAGCTLLLRHRKGKGSKLKARAVELDDDGVKFFAEQVRGKLPKAPLVSTDAGVHWDDQRRCGGIQLAIIAANKTAKEPAQRIPDGASAYSFRHSRISELLQTYAVDPITVAQQTGTSVAMIEKYYFKFIAGSMRKKLNALKDKKSA